MEQPKPTTDYGQRLERSLRLLRHLALIALLSLLGFYLVSSYVALPTFWRVYEKRHPALDEAERRAKTVLGILGDPINFAFVGTQSELFDALKRADWIPADPITWGTSARIAIDSVAHRTYDAAPVSDLYVWGKKQDVAFEQPYGPDPRKRHHVRFWRSKEVDEQGRPLWLGAATFDARIGVSHLTGQVTHHIDADVDKERDKLAGDFSKNASLLVKWLDGFQLETRGKNGGGDPYFTDGRLCVVRVTAEQPLLRAAQEFFAPVIDLVSSTPAGH